MSNRASEEKVKIGGWLIVVGVLLWLGVLSDFLNILLRTMVNSTHHPTVHGILVNEVINFVVVGDVPPTQSNHCMVEHYLRHLCGY